MEISENINLPESDGRFNGIWAIGRGCSDSERKLSFSWLSELIVEIVDFNGIVSSNKSK